MKTAVKPTLAMLCLALLATLPLAAQDLASIEKRVTVHKMKNGLTAVIYERPEAPVFSFFTVVDAGSVQDPKGMTGLAHMMEHEAFKGTDKIGTTNWPAEKAALARLEVAYAAYRAELDKTTGRDEKKLAQLEKAFNDARAAADKFVVKNEFSKILDSDGAVGVNAFTANDETGYFYSFPSNRLELWAYLESERFLHPVMREFYTERDVVYEERRMRTDSSPIGRLVEQFLAAAFTAHSYRNPPVGWPGDLKNFSATDAMNFFKKYYIPSNMVVGVVGDVKAAPTIAILEKYFGRIPSGPKPPEYATSEPPQSSERRVVLREATQPIVIEGYHRPNYRDPDDAGYDVLADLLSRGRTSRLYRSLVRDQKIALQAQGFTNFPGVKYAELFAFLLVPNAGHTPEEIIAAARKELDRLRNEDVSDEELASVKTRAKADIVRGLKENDNLAEGLAEAQLRFGDWRELFRHVDRIDKVTKADIRRLANKIFVPENRTLAFIENPPKPEAAPRKGGE